MNNSILIIAHAPLANALRQCALHVFPDCGDGVAALDVQPNVSPEETFQAARISLEQARSRHVLVLTDVFGATPCNVAQRLVGGVGARLVTGVNLPMLLRAVSYRAEPLDSVVARAVVGGTQGVMQVGISAPQNQHHRQRNDQEPYDHHQ